MRAGSLSRALTGLVAVACLLAPAPAAAAPEPAPYGADDFRGFRNILPPGQGGHASAADIGAFLTTGRQPPHFDDQLRMYADLVYEVPGLEPADLRRFFKDATFGVRGGDVERQYSPRDDVTIQRDRGFGVPHIYGGTRGGAMFGAGYVAAEDRLFFIDVLRNLGRARLSSFVGGDEGTRAMDAEQWSIAPYTEADLQRQVEQLDDLYGADGARVQEDARHYVEGINAYIREARLNPNKMPGEYLAINRPQGPEDWRPTDLIATAALVGGIFGKGGGREVDAALVYEEARRRFGGRAGRAVFEDFRSAEDPEAPTTVQGRRFPYQVPPRRFAPGSRALPDAGTTQEEQVAHPGGGAAPVPGGLDTLLPGSLSNALVVSGRESRSGRPLAVFGPQTGYFAPQILMEMDIHGPGIDARGASFPGVNLYVQLGRGQDYAWSATSAGQDNTDTFAVDLCNPDGSPATRASDHYLFRGACVPMEVLERRNQWAPSPADQTPPGSETLRVFRTALGIVRARAQIDGRWVAYTVLRSTYLHEVDSARGFADFNDPGKIRNARDYQRAAHKIGYTFNWLYVDDRDAAYFNSGDNPERAEGLDHSFPVRGRRRFEWRGFDPGANTARYTPFAEHPQALNQPFFTSWNNKQARAYRAADSQFGFSSVYRSQPLDDRIRRGIRGSRRMTLTGLTEAMEDAGTVDLRGDRVLPLALELLGRPSDPALRDAVAKLRSWERAGAHRRDRDRSGTYEHSEAIRIMDLWWPRLMQAQFEPVLGPALFARLKSFIKLDNEPNDNGQHRGSAYQDGWYGYASKDLRAVLGRRVRGRYSRAYCGRGDEDACRRALASSLRAALAAGGIARSARHAPPPYEDEVCEEDGRSLDPQLCYDAVRHFPLGAIEQPLIHWINRPTFQQVVEVRGHRARPAQRPEGDRRRSPGFTG